MNEDFLPISTENNPSQANKPSIWQHYLEQIESLKDEIQTFNNKVKEGQQLFRKEVIPLYQKWIEKRLSLLSLFQEWLEGAHLSFEECYKLKEIILKESKDLVENHQLEEAEPYYALHSDIPLKKRNDEFFQKKQSYEQNESHNTDNEELQKKAPQQVIKNLYKQLAKQLHPDQESNEELKNLKTEQMHALNEAYQKQDISELLQIQKRVGEDQLLSAASEQEIINFTNLLEAQIKDLEYELASTKRQKKVLQQRVGGFGFTKVQIRQEKAVLKAQIQEADKKIKHLVHLEVLQQYLEDYEVE